MASTSIRVRLFARYAELAGHDVLEVELPAPATVADVVARVRGAHPGASAIPARPLVAVNLEHATPDTPVAPGDEVALLPPLSGG